MWLGVFRKRVLLRIGSLDSRFPVTHFVQKDTTPSMVWWWNDGGTTHNMHAPHTNFAPNVCDRSHHGKDGMSASHVWWVL